MPPSQFINPLPLVNQFLPAPVDNSAAEKLQIGAALQQLKNSGVLANTQLQNEGGLARTLAPLGLSPDTAGAGLPTLNKDIAFERRAKAVSNIGGSGVAFTLPGAKEPQATLGTIGNLPLESAPFKQVAAEREKAKFEAERSKKDTRAGFRLRGGPEIGLVKFTEESSSKVKASQQNTLQAKDASSRMLAAAQAQFPGAKIEGPFTVQGETFIK